MRVLRLPSWIGVAGILTLGNLILYHIILYYITLYYISGPQPCAPWRRCSAGRHRTASRPRRAWSTTRARSGTRLSRDWRHCGHRGRHVCFRQLRTETACSKTMQIENGARVHILGPGHLLRLLERLLLLLGLPRTGRTEVAGFRFAARDPTRPDRRRSLPGPAPCRESYLSISGSSALRLPTRTGRFRRSSSPWTPGRHLILHVAM